MLRAHASQALGLGDLPRRQAEHAGRSLLHPGLHQRDRHSDPCAEPDWFGTVRGRLGLAIWDRTLVYGTGGVMYGEEVVNTSLTFPLVGYQATSSSTHTGWVAGGGIEYAFTNALSAKLEGLYYNMGSETIAFTSPLTHFSETSNYAYQGAMVRLGANLKFGP
jgi:outer membrane immunogenic protein